MKRLTDAGGTRCPTRKVVSNDLKRLSRAPLAISNKMSPEEDSKRCPGTFKGEK